VSTTVGAKLASCLRIETTSGSFRAMSASSDTVVGGTLGESGVGVGACGMILLVSVFVFFLSSLMIKWWLCNFTSGMEVVDVVEAGIEMVLMGACTKAGVVVVVDC
jgi:hypothetical protein